MTALYGLPEHVEFCKRCVISNQRMSSVVERTAKPEDPKPTIAFGSDGVCSACRYAEHKKTIDWAARERKLVELCERYKECVVPGSGGKDSCYTAHILKTKYGMNVRTVTAAPLLYTDIGRANFEAWTKIADNVLVTPHDYRERCRDSFLHYLHPFRPFIIEQRRTGPWLARSLGIKLVFYGECPAERGGNEHELESPVMDRKYYGGIEGDVEVHYLGWYLPWKSQDNYYYAVQNCGFTPNTERTQGTYSKLSSLDDVLDFAHYLTTYAKTGLGRASYNAVEDVRDGFLTREEAVALVKRYDHEWPSKHMPAILDYLQLSEREFVERLDAGRSPHLWERVSGEWRLKKAVWQ
jgi:hypothetical protein